MRTLRNIQPTSEQLSIVSRNRPGIEIIRGAAGSGKTTTALLRLTSLIGMTIARKARENDITPIQILVLTFNKTLSGYIKDLVFSKTLGIGHNLTPEICTFGKWAHRTINPQEVLNDNTRKQHIKELGKNLPLDPLFVTKETDYVLSRFLPHEFNKYLTVKREGRGASPRMPQVLRQKILEDVILPYTQWKRTHQVLDWFDMEVIMATKKFYNYDIIIADETQDFSANQLRAIQLQAADTHSITFVVDTAQRIYARGFTWQECGLTIRPEMVHRLQNNYRNTSQILNFSISLLNGIEADDDATIPSASSCQRQGPLPSVLIGRFSKQLTCSIQYIKDNIDLTNESVAFLLPQGGRWFDQIKLELHNNRLDYVEITRNSDWPQGTENIALSTIHSSKGLEFDHVIIIGINSTNCAHGPNKDDDELTMLRRLLAVGISRARSSVLLGYNPTEKSDLMDYFIPGTFTELHV